MSDHLTRKVCVNGVRIDLFDDEAARRGAGRDGMVFPVTGTLEFLEAQTVVPQDPAAIAALREAGVRHVPLYLSEAKADGVKWEELA